jgi:hypothetical protein
LLLVSLQLPQLRRLLHLLLWVQHQLLALLSLLPPLLLLLPAWVLQLPCLMQLTCLYLLQPQPLLLSTCHALLPSLLPLAVLRPQQRQQQLQLQTPPARQTLQPQQPPVLPAQPVCTLLPFLQPGLPVGA